MGFEYNEIEMNVILDFLFFCGFTVMLCFQGLFFCPDAASLLLHNFCIYHINAPGHEVSISVTV